MTTRALESHRIPKVAIVAGLLVGLAILLATNDPTNSSPYVLLGIALVFSFHGYFRSRPRRPWDGNDEPY